MLNSINGLIGMTRRGGASKILSLVQDNTGGNGVLNADGLKYYCIGPTHSGGYTTGATAALADMRYVTLKMPDAATRVRFALQSGGGSGPYDDGDGATASGSGALVYMDFTGAQLAAILGKTIVVALGPTDTSYGNSSFMSSPAHQTVIPADANISALANYTSQATTQSGYGGYGAVDCGVAIAPNGASDIGTTNLQWLAFAMGGVASPNYDGGPSYNAGTWNAPSATSVITGAGIAALGRSTHGVPNASPWSNNVSGVSNNFWTNPFPTAGRGGAAMRGEGEAALFILEITP